LNFRDGPARFYQRFFERFLARAAPCRITARQYLKNVFEKTGARRQLDLIRLIERALAQNGCVR